MIQPITIDIFSDTICPWCYIGHKKLLSANAPKAASWANVEGSNGSLTFIKLLIRASCIANKKGSYTIKESYDLAMICDKLIKSN